MLDSISVVVSLMLMSFARVQYTSTKLPNVKDHPLRKLILERIKASPGVHLSSLRETVDCSWGTIQYHTRLLEEIGALRSSQGGRRRRLFLSSMDEEEFEAYSVLERGRAWDLVRSVLRSPGIIQSELTQELEMSRKVVRRYIDRLVGAGLLREVKEHQYRIYFPTKRLVEFVSGLPEEVSSGIKAFEKKEAAAELEGVVVQHDC